MKADNNSNTLTFNSD